MMLELEKRVAAIEARNKKVELDKAWETSWVRRLCIALITYVTVFIFLKVINNDNPAINALVPTGGFLLSTLAMRQIRNVWETSRQK
jgi:hypothetical protein